MAQQSIPDEYINDLLAQVPIAEVAELFVKLTPDGPNRMKGCCPMHEEKTPSFKVDKRGNHCYCYGCGKGGDAIGLVQEVRNLSFPDAVRWLASSFHLSQPPRNADETSPQDKRKGVMRWAHTEAMKFHETQLWSPSTKGADRARDYLLKERGFSEAILRKFTIGFAPRDKGPFLDSLGQQFNWKLLEEAGLMRSSPSKQNPEKMAWYPFFFNRITFPIRTSRGTCIGFGARKLDGDGAKYVNSPDTPLYHKSQVLYGLYESLEAPARGEEARTLRITEGYTDVLRAHEVGLGRTVAPCGTAFTEEQANICYRYADHLVFYFDGDRAGREAAFSACSTILPLINGDRRASVVFLGEGEDLDTVLRKGGADAMTQLERKASPLSLFVMDYCEGVFPGGTVEARTRCYKQLNELAKKVVDDNYRRLLLSEIAQRYQPAAPVTNTPEELAEAYQERLPEKVVRLLDQASPLVIQACSVLCSHPYWSQMMTFDSDVLNPAEKNLIDFAGGTAKRAVESDTAPEQVFRNDYRYLVMYLKALGSQHSEPDRVRIISELQTHCHDAAVNPIPSAPAATLAMR